MPEDFQLDRHPVRQRDRLDSEASYPTTVEDACHSGISTSKTISPVTVTG
jgi:hypothetical protein